MFNSQHYRALVHLKPQKFYPLLPLPFSLKFKFCTSASESESEPDSFTVSYLINNVGFPQEAKRLRFKTTEKPDSVFTFFRDRGFSDANTRDIVTKEPWLLSSNPHKSILPKFHFFLSKGASSSDITRMLTARPRILQRSLEKRIIPQYELLKRFLKSDKDTIAHIIRYWIPMSDNLTMANLKLMIDYGVCDSSIARLLLTRPSLLSSPDWLKSLEEVKGLGFNPSKFTFGVALVAKKGISKIRWDEKVDAYRKWGWSDENVLQAFRWQPNMILVSRDKINLVLSFWVNQLGWNSLALTKGPEIFGYSLQKRIIPRFAKKEFKLS